MTEVAEILDMLAVQERYVLSLLLTHRRDAQPIATAAGLDVRHFAYDDHRLIFAGWLVACEDDFSTLVMLRAIRRALQTAGHWEPTTLAGDTGSHHSDATLARMATARLTEEELDDFVERTHGDGLRRAIARQVTALIDAAEAVEVWNL